jgi:membrane fusion protein, multidrug efflux system
MRLRCPTILRSVVLATLLLALGCGPGGNTYVEPPPPEVTVTLPVKKDVPDSLDLTGTTAAIESVEVRARVQGFLEKVDFKDSAKVKAGDLLFEIDPKPYQADYDRDAANLAQAKARLERATADFTRAEELLPKNAIAKSDYDLALSSRSEAAASVKVAEANLRAAQLNLDYTKVLAPISGRIGRRLVDKGNLVGANEKTLLATIVNDDLIYAYANMSENDQLRIMRRYPQPTGKDGARKDPEKVQVALLGLADETGYPHKGWLDYADNKVDRETGTRELRAVFPNKDGLLMAGMFVRLSFPMETRPVLLVPAIAVLDDPSGRYVLVVGEKDVVEQRSVTAGRTFDHMRVIEDGLSPTDRVIINGLQRARPGATVKPVMATTEKKGV